MVQITPPPSFNIIKDYSTKRVKKEMFLKNKMLILFYQPTQPQYGHQHSLQTVDLGTFDYLTLGVQGCEVGSGSYLNIFRKIGSRS